MTKLKFVWDEEEEEKEETFSTKLKFTELIKPTTTTPVDTQPTGGATLTTLPSKYKIQSLSLKEDYERKTLETPGISQRMRGIGEAPKGYNLESVAIDYIETNKKSWGMWFSELKLAPNKWEFLKDKKNWSPELKAISEETKTLGKKASELGINPDDWIKTGVYAGFFAMLAVGIYPVIKGLPANILNNLTYKVEGKTVKGQELKNILWKAAYSKTTEFERKVFDEFTRKGGLKGIGGSLKKGLTITEVKPRFAFGTKLYAGLPADEIAKSIVEVGKVTTEAVKGLDPAKAIQVYQTLSSASPALANEFLKAVEKPEIKEIPLDIEENELVDMDDKPVELNKDGTITLYHRTTPENAEKIKNTGNFISKENLNETYFSTKIDSQSVGYGEAVVAVKVKPSLVRLDDAFHKGDISVAVSNKDLSKKVIIETPKALEPLAEEAREGEYLYRSHDVLDLERLKKEGLISKTPQEAARLARTKLTPEELKGWPSISQEVWGVEEQRTKNPRLFFTPKEKTDYEGELLLRVKKDITKDVGELVEDVGLPGEFFIEGKVNIPPQYIEVKQGDKWIPLSKYKTTPTLKAGVKVEPVKVEAKIEPTVDLATPIQIKKAHAIANTKQYISEKGKVKPQYRRLAEAMTGKKSTKDMTPEEAEMFIDALSRLPEPKYRGGKLVPPSIPRTMKLTTEGFFKKKYKEPTPIWLLTDQTYYATKLGIKPLVAPFEKGKQTFDLEFRQSSNLVDRMVSKLNKIAKTPGMERIKSTIKNIPTKAETKMAELLNEYETTPTGLIEKKADVFKYFRNLYKDIWRRENEVREKVDLPSIKYKTAYFRHTADAMAKEMLEGKYPFPEGIKYWSEKMVGKKVFNPMEFQRKLSDDLIDIWSKDLRAVTKAILWNGLKEIHLAEPSKFLNEQLNAISKDLPEYKNLSPRDQAAYDQTRVMPSSTKKWLINYVNQVLKGQETELDASLNRIVTKSGLKGIFDKVLSPFGRTIGRKPITNLFMLSGRAVISGVMGWIPRQIMRNSFQPVQNLALYGVKATIKSYLPASVDKNLKDLLSESLFKKSYTGYEELPTNLMAKLEKVWLTPYGIVAVNNAKLGMKAAYWDTLDLITNPRYKKNKWCSPQRTKDTPKGFLYPIEKEYLSKEMEFGASCTQYQYIPMGMPGVFRYKALIPLTRLQSWWMNYFTKFNREAIHRGLKGRPSWSDEGGPTLPWSRRVNYLKYLVIGGALLTALGYKKSFMLGVAPTYLSPAGQVALGIYNYATAKSDWQKQKSLRQIYYSWKAFIPGSLAWRDFLAVWNGEKELNEILFYGKKEKKKVQPPLKITTPKNGKLKFTETEIDIKSTKLKFNF